MCGPQEELNTCGIDIVPICTDAPDIRPLTGGGGGLEPSQIGVGSLAFQFGRQIYHAKSRG